MQARKQGQCECVCNKVLTTDICTIFHRFTTLRQFFKPDAAARMLKIAVNFARDSCILPTLTTKGNQPTGLAAHPGWDNGCFALRNKNHFAR
jgi:hypothetical protein